MPRLVRFTLPAIDTKVPSRHIIINMDHVRDICPRYVAHPDDPRGTSPWLEAGTWIKNGGDEGSTFHIVESFEFVLQQLMPTKVMREVSRG